MRAAKLSTSPRLRRSLAVLEARRPGWVTTRALIREAHVCAVNSIVAELRANGARIACEQYADARGRRRWRYRLEALPEGWRP